MKHLCPLYNGQNLNFTGNQNPYGLIQNGGKRKSRRSKRKYSKKRSDGRKRKSRRSKKRSKRY